MGLEIERKFLLKNELWREFIVRETPIKQGYLNAHKERTVRIRIYGNEGIITIKGKTENFTRAEFEYSIPLEDALAMLNLCEQPIIEKVRFEVVNDRNIWEIDEFSGNNQGLIVAELELKSADEQFLLPAWIGEEVTHNIRYYNSSLIAHPFKNWKK